MILITGASSGIGKACAEAFAEKGHALLLIARRAEKLEALKKSLSAHASRIETLACDIRDQKALDLYFAKHPEILNDVECVINNAGLAKGLHPFQDSTPEEYQEMFSTNVEAVVHLTRRVLPAMISHGRGHLIQIGSVAGRWFYPNGHLYAMSKAAIRAFNESLRLDLQGKNIRVTEIAPGMVETEFSKVRFSEIKDGDQKADKVYDGIDALTSEDIARSVLFCFEQPPHVNIQELVIYPTQQASTTQVYRKTSK
jgi:3-hydroxy acid dehydrogenase / malonic semialdehyde reductase